MDCTHVRLPCPIHHLLELAQTHVHWVSDATQPSHPLLPPSPLALNLSQHQGFFPRSWLISSSSGQRIGASASVLPMYVQGWFPLGLTCLISLQSKGLSRVLSCLIIYIQRFLWKHLMDVHLLLQSCNPNNSRLSAAKALALPSCMPACLPAALSAD